MIRLTRHKEKPVEVKDEALLFALIRAAFNQRRKTLQNAISNAGLGITKEQVLEALTKLNLSPTIRGEALNLKEFAALSDELTTK